MPVSLAFWAEPSFPSPAKCAGLGLSGCLVHRILEPGTLEPSRIYVLKSRLLFLQRQNGPVTSCGRGHSAGGNSSHPASLAPRFPLHLWDPPLLGLELLHCPGLALPLGPCEQQLCAHQVPTMTTFSSLSCTRPALNWGCQQPPHPCPRPTSWKDERPARGHSQGVTPAGAGEAWPAPPTCVQTSLPQSPASGL